MSAKPEDLVTRHLRLGWGMFFFFLVAGAVLEALHGFKVGWYVGGAAETRRLLWTLAHAHGTLFGLAHVALAATIKLAPDSRWSGLESHAFTAGSLMVPLGFFLGGVRIYDGDPGLGVLLVPPGVLLLAFGALLVFFRVRRTSA